MTRCRRCHFRAALARWLAVFRAVCFFVFVVLVCCVLGYLLALVLPDDRALVPALL